MTNKRINLFFVLMASLCSGQDYLDLFKVSYGYTGIGYKNSDTNSAMHAIDASLLIPVPLNESTFILTGVDFNSKQLDLNPESDYFHFNNTVLKLGISKNFNEKWNAYILALPKFSSDYNDNFGSSFLMGGLGMVKYKKKENLTYKLGFYGSQEAYGFFGTPILGFFYKSPNQKLTMDVSLPLLADVNYGISQKSSVGLDFVAIRRSFFLGQDTADQLYVENNEISFTPYFQLKTLKDQLLLKLKAGYSSADFGVYRVDDESMVGISAFNFGEERTRLNAETNGGLQLKLEAVYRIGTGTKMD